VKRLDIAPAWHDEIDDCIVDIWAGERVSQTSEVDGSVEDRRRYLLPEAIDQACGKDVLASREMLDHHAHELWHGQGSCGSVHSA
jgi:hypothetical protein